VFKIAPDIPQDYEHAAAVLKLTYYLFQSALDDVYLGQMPVKQPTMSVSFCNIFCAVFSPV